MERTADVETRQEGGQFSDTKKMIYRLNYEVTLTNLVFFFYDFINDNFVNV